MPGLSIQDIGFPFSFFSFCRLPIFTSRDLEPRFPFARLPPELRLLIYNEYLGLERGTDLSVEDVEHWIILKREGQRWTGWSSGHLSLQNQPPSILATSRQIRSEVLPVLFGARTWWLPSQLAALEFLKQIGEGRKHVKSLQMTRLCVGFTSRLMRFGPSGLYRCPALQELKLLLHRDKPEMEEEGPHDSEFRGMEGLPWYFVIEPSWDYDGDRVDGVVLLGSDRGIYDWFDFLVEICGHIDDAFEKIVFYLSVGESSHQTRLLESEQQQLIARWKSLQPAYTSWGCLGSDF